MAVDTSVSVIIAAWNAQATIARAVDSALRQPETHEVIVVDDCSTDQTVAAARSADDGSGRLRILSQTANGGPSVARNRGIAESRGAIVAILDSDDFFLPGRLAYLLDIPGWDVIIDNIVFITEDQAGDFGEQGAASFPDSIEPVGLAAFVAANISGRSDRQKEMGFAKPLIRRRILTENGLTYDTRVRLGEDYVLYSHILATGARFLKTNRCGYVAVERPSSLSGAHQTSDLRCLLDANRGLMALPNLTGDERAAFRKAARHVAGKLWHRQVLDERGRHGLAAGIAMAIGRPLRLPGLALSVLHDKMNAIRSQPLPEYRYLLR